MKNEYENNGENNGNRTESVTGPFKYHQDLNLAGHSHYFSLPNTSSPTRRHEPISVQNAPPCLVINLTDTESDIEDEVIFVSSQPLIPTIDISTPPRANPIPASCLPSVSTGIERHDLGFNFALNVSEVEPADTWAKLPTCSICLSSLEKPHSTLCGHIFCERCITNAVKTAKKCPYCCKKLNMTQIHPVYF